PGWSLGHDACESLPASASRVWRNAAKGLLVDRAHARVSGLSHLHRLLNLGGPAGHALLPPRQRGELSLAVLRAADLGCAGPGIRLCVVRPLAAVVAELHSRHAGAADPLGARPFSFHLL